MRRHTSRLVALVLVSSAFGLGACHEVLGLSDISDQVDGGAGSTSLGGEGNGAQDGVGGKQSGGASSGGASSGGSSSGGGTSSGGKTSTGGTPGGGGTSSGGTDTGGGNGTGGTVDVPADLNKPCSDAGCAHGLTCSSNICKLDMDQPCNEDDDCATGTCFEFCQVPGDVGAECNSAPDCNNELALSCFSGSCRLANGQACAADTECVSGSCAASWCAAPVAHGGTCDSTPDCSANLQCASTTCKWVNGQTCSSDGNCASGSCGTTNVCQAKGGLNAACNGTPDCQTNFYCHDSDVCKKNNGVACSADSECGSGACAVGTCANPAGALAPCDTQADCLNTTMYTCNASACRIRHKQSCANATNACVTGEVCSSTSKLCLVPLNGDCVDGSDCITGVCDSGSDNICE